MKPLPPKAPEKPKPTVKQKRAALQAALYVNRKRRLSRMIHSP